MGGEDFAYYLEHVPGAFFYLGVGMEDIQQRFPWHHPKFQIEPSCLPVGAAVLAQVVLDTLGGSYE